MMVVVVEVEVVLVRCWTSWSLIGDVGEVLILIPFPPRNPDRVFPQTLSSLPARGEIIDFFSLLLLLLLLFFFYSSISSKPKALPHAVLEILRWVPERESASALDSSRL